MIEPLIKLSTVAVLGVILSAVLKRTSGEYRILISIVISTAITFFAISMFSELISTVYSYSEKLNIDSKYFDIVLKVLAVGYITGFASDIAKDAGEGAVASKIELAGRIVSAFLSLPVLKGLIDALSNVGWY